MVSALGLDPDAGHRHVISDRGITINLTVQECLALLDTLGGGADAPPR